MNPKVCLNSISRHFETIILRPPQKPILLSLNDFTLGPHGRLEVESRLIETSRDLLLGFQSLGQQPDRWNDPVKDVQASTPFHTAALHDSWPGV